MPVLPSCRKLTFKSNSHRLHISGVWYDYWFWALWWILWAYFFSFFYIHDRKLNLSVYGKCHSVQNFLCPLCPTLSHTFVLHAAISQHIFTGHHSWLMFYKTLISAINYSSLLVCWKMILVSRCFIKHPRNRHRYRPTVLWTKGCFSHLAHS